MRKNEDMTVYAKSLHCSPESMTTLLIQNKYKIKSYGKNTILSVYGGALQYLYNVNKTMLNMF